MSKAVFSTKASLTPAEAAQLVKEVNFADLAVRSHKREQVHGLLVAALEVCRAHGLDKEVLDRWQFNKDNLLALTVPKCEGKQ